MRNKRQKTHDADLALFQIHQAARIKKMRRDLRALEWRCRWARIRRMFTFQ